MKHLLTIMMLYMTALLAGFEKEPGLGDDATSDEQVAEIRTSTIKTWDVRNEDMLLSFKDTRAISVF